MKTVKHLFVDQCDGHLYDTRHPNWAENPPLRRRYKYLHNRIKTTAQLKACLRHGLYAWPGGYACAFTTADGAILSEKAVLENLRSVMDSLKTRCNDGWLVEGVICTAELDDPIYCDHSGEEIE